MTRRSFYEWSVFALGGVIQAALALPALAYLLIPGKKKGGSEWADAGSLSALPADRPTEIAFQRERQDAWKTSVEKTTAWAVKANGSEVVVFAPQCTHLGCGYHWVEADQHFLCPCHDSVFNKDGSVISGVAPRPLDRFETKIEGDRLWLGPISPAEKG
jgi:quinol---cytochrome c reductase iron-sulfur subunit, bacillus type